MKQMICVIREIIGSKSELSNSINWKAKGFLHIYPLHFMQDKTIDFCGVFEGVGIISIHQHSGA